MSKVKNRRAMMMSSMRIFRPSVLFRSVLFAVLLFTAAAYAQSDDYRPRPTPSDCDAYARNYAERYSGSFLGGAARGAIGGGVFGAIVGNRKSLKRGAALGAILGGSKRAIDRNRIRQRAYDDCMAGRVNW